jgi:transposase
MDRLQIRCPPVGFPMNDGRGLSRVTLPAKDWPMHRRYDKQFREQAINLVTEQRRDPTGVARDLGMPASTLFKWLKEMGWTRPVDAGRSLPLPDDVAVLKARICQLEAQVRDLEIDREILKKATAFFAHQSK